MPLEVSREAVAEVMDRVNQAWLRRRLADLRLLLHPDVVMVLPGFAGQVVGREAVLGGFQEFCESAVVDRFDERDRRVDVMGGSSVVSFGFEMVYERSGKRWLAQGRDVWVFTREAGEWLVAWRALIDLSEQPA